MSTQNTTWTPAWTVRYDGSQLDAFEVRGAGGSVQVRSPGAPTYGRWERAAYDKKFGATPEEAIAKFLAHARHEIEMATEELRAAQALLARGLALTTDTEATH